MRIRLILIVLLLILSGGHLPAQATDKQDAYTPEKGTEERKAILDALREKLFTMHGIEVIFVVNYMKVYDGWAWVHTLPQDAHGSNKYEDVLALIHREEDVWKVIEIPCAEEDNPLCITSENYYEGLIKRHTGLPECILPIN